MNSVSPDFQIDRSELLQEVLTRYPQLPEELLKIASDGYFYRDSSLQKQEGLLTSYSLKRSFDSFAELSQSLQNRFLQILQSFSSENSAKVKVAKSLLLKALASHENDLEVVSDFAVRLQSYSARQMINLTTLVEIDYTHNSDPFESSGLRETATTDATILTRRAQNDGANQSFITSCMPASVLIFRAEWDPVFALNIHENGFDAPMPDSLWSLSQRQILENSDFWRQRGYKRPFYRIQQSLLQNAEILPMLYELYQKNIIPRDDFEIILRKLDRWAWIYCESWLKGLREATQKMIAELPPVQISWFQSAVNRLGFGEPPVDAEKIKLVDLLSPYQSELLKLIHARGLPQENNLDLQTLFDPKQFSTLGSPTKDAFTPENLSDAQADFVETPIHGNETAVIRALYKGLNLVLNHNAHATVLCDARWSGAEWQVYQADPQEGTGEWIALKRVNLGSVVSSEPIVPSLA